MYVSYRGQVPGSTAPVVHASDQLADIAELVNCSYDDPSVVALGPGDGALTGVARVGTCSREGDDPLTAIEAVVVDDEDATVVAFGSSG